MCVSPIILRNPNYSENPTAVGAKVNRSRMSYLKDTHHSHIKVPCGHCHECISLSQNYLVQRAREEFKDSYCFFVTLTYSPEMIPSIDLDGFIHHYADIRDFQLFVKRIRKDSLLPDFKYCCVTEYGTEKHRPHFHCLFFFQRSLFDSDRDAELLEAKFDKVIQDQWKRRVGGTHKDPIYKPLSRFIRRGHFATWDCHLVTENRFDSSDPSDVAFYVTKYCLKYDKWIENKRGMLYHKYPSHYSYLWNLFRPRVLLSKGFGVTSATADFISRCIEFSDSNALPYPQYYNDDNSSFAMSRYYVKKYMSELQKWNFIKRNPYWTGADNPNTYVDSSMTSPILSPEDVHKLAAKNSRFAKVCKELYQETDAFLLEIEDPEKYDEQIEYNFFASSPKVDTSLPDLDYDFLFELDRKEFNPDNPNNEDLPY